MRTFGNIVIGVSISIAAVCLGTAFVMAARQKSMVGFSAEQIVYEESGRYYATDGDGPINERSRVEIGQQAFERFRAYEEQSGNIAAVGIGFGFLGIGWLLLRRFRLYAAPVLPLRPS